MGCFHCSCPDCREERNESRDQDYDIAADIIRYICAKHWVSEMSLRHHAKTTHLAMARALAMYLIREMTNLSTPAIGRLFRRDHSTVVHHYQRIGERMERSVPYRLTIERMMSELRGQRQRDAA